jgi:hypothetical protein
MPPGPILLRLERFSAVLRWRYVVLAVLGVAWSVRAYLPADRTDWHFFVWGSQLLFGEHPPWAIEPGGLHLYANYRAQIGPLTLAVVAGLRRVWGDEGARIAAIVLMTAVGPLLVHVLERTAGALHPPDADDERVRQGAVLLGGAVVIVAWADLGAHWVHLDDALTLLLACLALLAITRGRPVTVGVMIGLATAAKPWGIAILPLVLVFHGAPRWRAGLAAGAMFVVAWAPFVIADPGTLSAGELGVSTSRASVLHLFGASVGSTPNWVRPAQLVLALALAVLAVRRGRWIAVLLLCVVVRVALDPAVFDYYLTAIVIGAFAWELLRSPRPVPVLTMSFFWLLLIADIALDTPTLEAILRLTACVAAVVGAFWLRPHARRCSTVAFQGARRSP